MPQLCQSCKKWINIGDCIRSDSVTGWTHTECPIGNGIERGIASIEKGFSKVSYSDWWRITEEENAPRALCSEMNLEAAEDETDQKRPASLLDADEIHDEQHKRAKTNPVAVSCEGDGEDNSSSYEDKKRTKEQCDILSYEPDSGEIIAVNAYAGCGKTTTVSLFPFVIYVMSRATQK